jgi:hypothetical protein
MLSQLEVQNAHEQGEADGVGKNYDDIGLKKSVHRPQRYPCSENARVLGPSLGPS